MRRIRHLTSQHRTLATNRLLGAVLAFIAGAINAGGFLLVGMYTSHMTGVITDLGIELGKMLYWNRASGEQDSTCLPTRHVRANRAKLRLYGTLLAMFLVGGVVGAAGFKYVGFAWVIPLALLLLALCLPPLMADARRGRLRLPG